MLNCTLKHFVLIKCSLLDDLACYRCELVLMLNCTFNIPEFLFAKQRRYLLMASIQDAATGLAGIDMILIVAGLQTPDHILSFPKDDFTSHCITCIENRSNLRSAPAAAGHPLETALKRYQLNGLNEELDLFYDRLSARGRAAQLDASFGVTMPRPKHHRVSHPLCKCNLEVAVCGACGSGWDQRGTRAVSFMDPTGPYRGDMAHYRMQPPDGFGLRSNSLSCPPILNVVLPGVPPRSGSTCVTTREKLYHDRMNENRLLLEILTEAGTHAKLWSALQPLNEEGRKVYKDCLWQEYAPTTLRGTRQKMQKWLAWHATRYPDERNQPFWPLTTEKVMDYLAARVVEKCGHSVPGMIKHTVIHVCKLFQMECPDLETTHISNLILGHSKTRTELAQAPDLTVEFIGLLEKGFHSHKSQNDATALICGLWLFMIVTSMRFSDTLCLKPWTLHKSMLLIENEPMMVFKAACWKSKSDKTGKRSQLACPNFFLHQEWLEEWYHLYMCSAHRDADFMFPHTTLTPRPNRAVLMDFSKPAEYHRALEASKACFRSLAFEQAKPGLVDEIHRLVFHSCRATFSTLAALANCSVAQILVQMRSETPAMAMRYQRQTGMMAATLSSEISTYLKGRITSPDPKPSKSSKNVLTKDDRVHGTLPTYETNVRQFCPWCPWEIPCGNRSDLVEHMMECDDCHDEEQYGEDDDDEENTWFKPSLTDPLTGKPFDLTLATPNNSDEEGPTEAEPDRNVHLHASYFHWHLPDERNIKGSRCGIVPKLTEISETCALAVPVMDVCAKCLNMAPERWAR